MNDAELSTHHQNRRETPSNSQLEQGRLLLSLLDVAAKLGVSLSHVKRLRASGRLPEPVRLGGRVLWRVDEIEAWVQAGCPAASQWRTMRKGSRR